MDRFQNKYRIPSARAQWWDYGTNAAYFVTICTQERMHFFGKIVETQFMASETGRLAEQYWNEIPNHFPFAQLGAFVVVPDHIHGIVIIDKHENGQNGNANVETRLIASLQEHTPDKPHKTGGFAGNKNPMLNDNLPRIVRWYKGCCSFEMRKIQPDFKWQARFHDHIIRNDAEYQRINDYIETNPLNWEHD